jgi:hypothetical protein
MAWLYVYVSHSVGLSVFVPVLEKWSINGVHLLD